MQTLTRIYEVVCCMPRPKFPMPYEFRFSAGQTIEDNKHNFQSNFVKTSKYSWYDFFPKALILQFYRLANIYFLAIGILQTIPVISPLGPLTAWAPLIVVLAISILRQGYEDYQRYKSDRQMNFELKTEVFRNGIFEEVEWSKVLIGDICRVRTEDMFPADLILIASSTDGGIAFIETASLDGEKNLKPRNAYPRTQWFNSEQRLPQLSGEWQGIVPDKELHRFNSKMVLNSQDKVVVASFTNSEGKMNADSFGHGVADNNQDNRVVFNGDKQLLYRGARLKNTKWVYGLAIYTGRNSKIMMNSDSSSQKMSQIENKVNYVLGIILIIQFVLCLVVAILYGNSRAVNETVFDYVSWTSYSVFVDSLLIFFSYFVLLNTMIPISLIVSIEGVKMSQSYFINRDQLMHSQFRNKYATVRSASLNEELGQIEYIFTDKTGTLTMNLMEFKIAVVGNHMFGDIGLIINDPKRPPQLEKGFQDADLYGILHGPPVAHGKMFSPITIERNGQSLVFSNIKELAEQYMTALAVAHEVVSETDKNGKIFYQGPSPDEISLVDAAKKMGFQFLRSTQSSTHLNVRNKAKDFQLLQVFPFTSDRKRMSVILKDKGIIKMYMKGADSIVKARLDPRQKLNLDDQLQRFSRIGLRTLLVGMKILSEDDYRTFRQRSSNLPSTNKEEAYNKLVDQFENSIYLIGATAVLDRLQEEVPQTIRDLIRAKIKIWMLTGDKMETAENIAKSCNLIQSSFEILKYSSPPNGDIAMCLAGLVQQARRLSQNDPPISKAFLIEGSDLTPIINNEANEIQLANLAKECEAVVCCRLLPIQKADVVRIVRQRLNKITLSIGDGANDVPMIKTAHIGVGLYGQEGMGAVQASDYALPEFRMLWRLLLVHGRWNYMRIAEMILYFFYKNMLFTIPQFVFAFFIGFSGQTIFEDNYVSLYNLIFTSFPLVVRAILQQDVNYILQSKHPQAKQESLHTLHGRQNKYIPPEYEMNKFMYRLFPKIYFIGQENCIFNYTNYFMWVGEGILEALLISLFCLYILGGQSIRPEGYSTDLWVVSLTIYSTVVMVVTMKLSTHTRFWSVILFLSIVVLSLGLYVAYMWVSDTSFSIYVQHSMLISYTTGNVYLVVIFCCCLVVCIDGYVVTVDFNRSRYASKMRIIIDAEKEESRSIYQQLSLRATDLQSQKKEEEHRAKNAHE